jgi:hypothetical protein
VELIFVHGGVAAGKLTTARALAGIIGYPVFHNHVVVDLLTPIFPFGSEPFVRLREQFWLAVFSEAALDDRSIIFTFAPEQTVAVGFPNRARAAVESRGGRVRFARLSVSSAEQERRISDPSRAEFTKVTDVHTLRQLREQHGIEQPPVDLEVNTDHNDADATAARIVSHFRLTPQQSPIH